MGVSFNAAALLNGNGIDVQSVVNAILGPENGSITLLQNQQTDLSTQAGLLSGYNNNLTSLAATVVALADPTGPLAAQSAASSDHGILTASAQTTATPGHASDRGVQSGDHWHALHRSPGRRR
jgi:flagellar capping protein FliD